MRRRLFLPTTSKMISSGIAPMIPTCTAAAESSTCNANNGILCEQYVVRRVVVIRSVKATMLSGTTQNDDDDDDDNRGSWTRSGRSHEYEISANTTNNNTATHTNPFNEEEDDQEVFVGKEVRMFWHQQQQRIRSQSKSIGCLLRRGMKRQPFDEESLRAQYRNRIVVCPTSMEILLYWTYLSTQYLLLVDQEYISSVCIQYHPHRIQSNIHNNNVILTFKFQTKQKQTNRIYWEYG